jgi:hypothetical protein
MAAAGITHSSEFPAVENPLSKGRNVDKYHRMTAECQWRLLYYPGDLCTGTAHPSTSPLRMR